MTEQARETPEPLTPEHERLADMAVMALGSVLTGNDYARYHALFRGRFVDRLNRAAEYRAALRAATPDPAEPGLRERIEAVVRDAQFPKHYSLDEDAGAHANFLLGAQEIQAVILRDLRAALSDTTEGQS
jgi:hypothetical protein